MKRGYCKPVIRKSDNRKHVDGTTEVLIYYHRYSTAYIKTGVRINPRHWSVKNEAIKDNSGFKNFKGVNEKIQKKCNEVESIIRKFYEQNAELPTGIQVIELHDGKGDSFKGKGYDLIFDMETWISRSNKSVESKKIYIQCLRYLKSFVGIRVLDGGYRYDLIHFKSIADVNAELLNAFIKWLSARKSKRTKSKLSNSTINKNIRVIQKFLRDKNSAGHKISADVLTLELDKTYSSRVALTDKELDQILNFDITNLKSQHKPKRLKNLALMQDIVRFNTFYGIRSSDLQALRKHNLKLDFNAEDHFGTIEYYSVKDKRQVELPIVEEEMYQLIEKYLNLDEDSTYFFPQLSLSTLNILLRELAKHSGVDQYVTHPIYSNRSRIERDLPKYKLLSMHSLRKTSINRNIRLYDRETAKFISKHQSESGFRVYEDESTLKEVVARMAILKK